MRIERAVREKTFTLTSIAGPSGSGKTYSALLYARGLVGPEGKIGFIDTENKRSRFYADVAGGFDVIDLDPPFTSARYIEAIKAFEKAGYTAIIIDSISHEWEGTGGVLEQAEAIEQSSKRPGLHCWAKPKAGHKKLMNELLQTRAHLIFCCRVKEKVVQAKGENGKNEIVNEGFVVVQEKMFIYEMTVSLMLAEGNHIPTILKCPGDLLHAFPEGSKITPKIGEAVRGWSDTGKDIDEAFELSKRAGMQAANGGMKSLSTWWGSLDKADQHRLANLKDTLKSVAEASDQMRSDQMEAGGGDVGERLAHAKSISKGAESGEGFNREFVTNQLKTLSSEPDAGEQGVSEEVTTPSNEKRDLMKLIIQLVAYTKDCDTEDKKAATSALWDYVEGFMKSSVINTPEGIEIAKKITRMFVGVVQDYNSQASAMEDACKLIGTDPAQLDEVE
nr:AAA family ATPase [Brucella anthropi]